MTLSFDLRVPNLETFDGKSEDKLTCHTIVYFTGIIDVVLVRSVPVVVDLHREVSYPWIGLWNFDGGIHVFVRLGQRHFGSARSLLTG